MPVLRDDAASVEWLAVCGVLLLVVLWEQYAPLRPAPAGAIGRRWPAHFLLLIVNNAVLLAIAAAIVLPERTGPGPLAWMPGWLAGLVTVLLIDLAHYGMHVAQHHVPWLWRFHRVHHGDSALDFTTTFRVHPVEAMVMVAISLGGLLLLQASPTTMLVLALCRAVSDGLAHGNIAFPRWLDRLLRLAVVTPFAHRVHHSTIRAEADSNYGVLLTVWDRIFGTYSAGPRLGLQGMHFGLSERPGSEPQRFVPLLLLPFARR